MTRRDLLKILLTAPIAATLDVEKLLWVPSPIITVPALPTLSIGEIVALEWEKVIKRCSIDLFNRDDVFFKMVEDRFHEHEINCRKILFPLELP